MTTKMLIKIITLNKQVMFLNNRLHLNLICSPKVHRNVWVTILKIFKFNLKTPIVVGLFLEKQLILVTATGDVSTVVHEYAHWYLGILQDAD